MIDLPGLLFVGAACFLIGMILVDIFWDCRVLEKPYTEETSAAITAFYTNNLVGMRRRAPYLIALFPLGFLVVITSLIYKCVHGVQTGDQHAVVTSAISIALLFPLIGLAAASTFPTIGAVITRSASLPLEERRRLHHRLFAQHVAYLVLTAAAVVVHVVF